VTARIRSGEHEVVVQHDVDAAKAIRGAVTAVPGIRIAAEIVGVGYRVNIPFPDGELNGAQHGVTSLEELWATPTPRLALHGPGTYRAVRALRALGLTAIPTRSDWVDVTPPNLSKATALEKVRTELGVEDHTTVAIGDGENDLETLMGATTGFSMGHAPAPVIAVADHVTGTIDQDGGCIRTPLPVGLTAPPRHGGGDRRHSRRGGLASAPLPAPSHQACLHARTTARPRLDPPRARVTRYPRADTDWPVARTT
jgi:hypothetical protein